MRFFLLTTFFMASAISLAAENTNDKEGQTFSADALPLLAHHQPSYLRGASRVLSQYIPRAAVTCAKFPGVCLSLGSLGPDCCRKQCVDVKTDVFNCGKCARRCKYSEACCGGYCANLMNDRNNCGGCNSKCKKGSSCTYGMCRYA